MILDLSAGYRHVWHDKNREGVIFLDRRPECEPTVLCDTRALPFKTLTPELVVFDPPHEATGNGKMSERYGVYPRRQEILDIVLRTAKEAARVCRTGTLMALKWNDHAWPLEGALGLMPDWEPLFGHGMRMPGRHKTQTSWVMLRRR